MITRPHAFLVLGLPVPQGDMVCYGGQGGHRLNHTNAKTLKPWRALITAGANDRVDETADPHQPLHVELTWSLPRPEGHWGTGRNRLVLKPSAPAYPTTRPDFDKLTRAVLDALTQSDRIPDDAQFVDGGIHKRYATHRDWDPRTDGYPRPDWRDVLPVPGVVIRLLPIEEDDA